MPRVGRKAPGGGVYHVLNRGNGRMRLFHKPGDYDAFLRLVADVRRAVGMRVLGFCLMPNHWHFALWPRHDGDLSRFMLRLTTAHVRRHHAHYRVEAGGHLYQGRFKSFPVQNDDAHFLTMMRYVEANAARAKLVRRAHDWRWGSLRARLTGTVGGEASSSASAPASVLKATDLLDAWPLDVPATWEATVDRRPPAEELAELRTSLRRGRPFGDAAWVTRTAAQLGLGFTLRERGRPKKDKAGEN